MTHVPRTRATRVRKERKRGAGQLERGDERGWGTDEAGERKG